MADTFWNRLAFWRQNAALPGPTPPTISQPRLDSSYDGGSMVNAISGLGTVNDKGSSARPNVYRQPLSFAELEVLYRWTAKRLIDIVPTDCTRKGWQVEVPDVTGNPFQNSEAELSIFQTFRMAHIWARVFGGARIWMVVKEEGDRRLSDPLDPAKVTEVFNLVVLTPDEYSPIIYNSNPEDRNYRRPELYNLSPQVGGPGQPVHHSRLLSFSGAALTAQGERRQSGNGESLLECWWDALRNDSQIGSAGSLLAQELSVFWIQMKNRAAASTGGQATGLLNRLKALNVSKSIANAILINEGEEIGEISRSTSGFRDLSDDAKKRLAMVTGYPEPVLYGQAPSGLNSDGESHQKLWQNIISGEHNEHYKRPLERIYEILWYAEHGGPPDHWTLKFALLDELTTTAEAALEKTHAETDAIRIDKGIITADEARTRWSESGYQNGLSVDWKAASPATEAAEAEAEAEAAAARAAAEAAAARAAAEAEAEAAEAEAAEAEAADLGEDGEDGEDGGGEAGEDGGGEAGEDGEDGGEDGDPGDGARDDSIARRITAAQRRRLVSIPRAAQRSAAKVLRWKRAHSKTIRGLSPAVLSRCRQLARGGKLTVQDLIDINSWHARSWSRTTLKPQFAGAPWKDGGYVAGQACGGEMMARFAAQSVARFAVRSDSETFRPPAAVAQAARRALEVREAQTPSNRAGTPVGLARARQLANRQPVSIDTLKRMSSFFSRHGKAPGSAKARRNPSSKAAQAWGLWGGSSGRAWAARILRGVE